MTSATATATAPVSAPVRGRGRPANFPGVETKKRLYDLPVTTIELLEALATKRDENLGVMVNAMLLRAHKEMTRK